MALGDAIITLAAMIGAIAAALNAVATSLALLDRFKKKPAAAKRFSDESAHKSMFWYLSEPVSA